MKVFGVRCDITPDGSAGSAGSEGPALPEGPTGSEGPALPLFGYEDRVGGYSGIDSRLEANILVLPTEAGRLALVALDTLFASAELDRAVRECLEGFGASEGLETLFVASHTHFAPALDPGKPVLGEMDQGYLEFVAGVVAEGISAAPHQGSPSGAHGDALRIFAGRADCDGGVYRRRRRRSYGFRPPFVRTEIILGPDPSVEIARDLTAWVGLNSENEARFVIWSWPCHPLFQANRQEISADFPGRIRDTIRAHFGNPDLPVLFFPGFCGDIRPNLPMGGHDSEVAEELVDGVEEVVLGVFEELEEVEAAKVFGHRKVRVPLGELLDGLEPAGSGAAPGSASGIAPGSASGIAPGSASGIETTPPRALEIHRLDAGPLGLLLLGAEVCQGYYDLLDFEEDKFSIFSGCVGPVYGYLPTDVQIREGGYESQGFFRLFSLSGRYRGRVQDRILSAVRGLWV